MTEQQPTRPRKLDRSIPLDLETIILKATAREPGHRYATARELADDLRSFLDDRPIRARRASIPDRLGRWCRRNKVLAGVSAFAAASFLAALVFAWVGYVTTRRALERSEADVALSLIAFGRLFDNLSNPFDRGPFADDVEPPPFPDRRPEDGGRTQTRGKGPPPGGMSMPLVGNFDERNAAVLESVLALYDKFAERNETDSKLQGEAARARTGRWPRFIG